MNKEQVILILIVKIHKMKGNKTLWNTNVKHELKHSLGQQNKLEKEALIMLWWVKSVKFAFSRLDLVGFIAAIIVVDVFVVGTDVYCVYYVFLWF